jgi:hypothetical protein
VRHVIALPLLCLLLGLPAAAEIYRCSDAEGKVHFVGDPSRCEGAAKHEPSREIVSSAPAAERAPRKTRAASLEDLLPGAAEIGPEWEITRELAVTQVDADQRLMGVTETQARHYGRTRKGVTEVCSIELWQFEEASQAAAAETSLPFPDWSFEARGALLVTLRGTRWQRGQAFQKGLFPDCHKLAALVRGL